MLLGRCWWSTELALRSWGPEAAEEALVERKPVERVQVPSPVVELVAQPAVDHKGTVDVERTADQAEYKVDWGSAAFVLVDIRVLDKESSPLAEVDR